MSIGQFSTYFIDLLPQHEAGFNVLTAVWNCFGRMYFILLAFSMVYATSGVVDLHCYNDYDTLMDCYLSPGKSNCSQFTMDLQRIGAKAEPLRCIFSESNKAHGECECSNVVNAFAIGEQSRARLWNSGKKMSEIIIDTTKSIKPRTPTTPTVKQTVHGNYLVSWKTNYNDNMLNLSTNLTYKKKGEENGESGYTTTCTSLQYEILGSDLDPSSNYIVTVRTRSDLNNIYSDSSGEASLSTPAAPQEMFITIIIVTCLSCTVAVIFAIVLFRTFFGLKDKLWNIIPKYAKPDLFSMVSVEPRILSPPQYSVCSIYVDYPEIDLTEGKQWSACSTEDGNRVIPRNGSGTDQDSSSLGYAHTRHEQSDNQDNVIAHVQEALGRIFPNLAPAVGSPQASTLSMNTSVADGGFTNMTRSELDGGHCVCPSIINPHDSNDIAHIPGSSSYDNATYVSTREPVVGHTLSCESAYLPGGTEVTSPQTCPGTVGQQDLPLSPNVSPLVQTDFSYQPCDNSFVSASSEEDIISSEINVPVSHSLSSVVVAGYQSFGDVVNSKEKDRETDECQDMPGECTQDLCSNETLVSDMNPCYFSVPTPEFRLPPSDDPYQALECLVQHSPVQWTLSLSGKHEGWLNECQESQAPQSITETMPFTRCQGGLFAPLGESFHTNLHTNSPYHCV